MKLRSISAAAMLFAATMGYQTAHAAIIMTNSSASSLAGKVYTYTPSFDPSGADKLVVLLNVEDGFSIAGTNTDVSNMKYNGVSMTKAVELGASVGNASIFYIDNPGTAGAITWTYSPGGGSNGSYITVLTLTGTNPGVGATSTAAAGTTGASASLTTTGNNSLVLATTYYNGGGSTAPTSVSQLTDVKPGGYWGSHYGWGVSGSEIVASPSSVTPTFTLGTATVAAEFTAAPVPEPATLALLGLGGLMMIQRRRASGMKMPGRSGPETARLPGENGFLQRLRGPPRTPQPFFFAQISAYAASGVY